MLKHDIEKHHDNVTQENVKIIARKNNKWSKFTIQPITIFLLKHFISYLRADRLFQNIHPSRPNSGRREKINGSFIFTLVCSASEGQ